MFVAEIGINHNGDIELAKKMIKMSKECGADVVKFQKRTPDVCVPTNQKKVIKETPWGNMSYLDYRKRLEFGDKEYDEIDRYCKELNIPWTASVWDIYSLYFILKYNPPYIKIPSACLVNLTLMMHAALSRIPVQISIGMSTAIDLDNAVRMLNKHEAKSITILQCNSSYPAKENELDLNVIPQLKKDYSYCEVGYSGHEEGIYPTILAAGLGASVIERHVTLDKELWGSDQKSSLNEEELKELISIIHKIPTWLGSNKITKYPSEELAAEKLRMIKY